MNVLLVNGSPRRNGNTARALDEIAAALDARGVASETFWPGPRPVHGCAACGACHATPGRCAFDDDPANALSDAFARADAFVIGSPVYYGQPNGALLALVQRACYSNSAAVAGKPCATLAVCRRGGATAAFQCLNMPFQMLDCLVVGSQYWNVAYGAAPGETALDAEGLQTLRRLADNLAWLLSALRAPGVPPRPPREPRTPTNFIR
ncbi:MAG: flavodoxin family protein [Kiritimatiellae bacterium]|nr:flavodoxin family protein [Kiritimatiellia bacterium]